MSQFIQKVTIGRRFDFVENEWWQCVTYLSVYTLVGWWDSSLNSGPSFRNSCIQLLSCFYCCHLHHAHLHYRSAPQMVVGVTAHSCYFVRMRERGVRGGVEVIFFFSWHFFLQKTAKQFASTQSNKCTQQSHRHFTLFTNQNLICMTL